MKLQTSNRNEFRKFIAQCKPLVNNNENQVAGEVRQQNTGQSLMGNSLRHAQQVTHSLPIVSDLIRPGCLTNELLCH